MRSLKEKKEGKGRDPRVRNIAAKQKERTGEIFVGKGKKEGMGATLRLRVTTVRREKGGDLIAVRVCYSKGTSPGFVGCHSLLASEGEGEENPKFLAHHDSLHLKGKRNWAISAWHRKLCHCDREGEKALHEKLSKTVPLPFCKKTPGERHPVLPARVREEESVARTITEKKGKRIQPLANPFHQRGWSKLPAIISPA